MKKFGILLALIAVFALAGTAFAAGYDISARGATAITAHATTTPWNPIAANFYPYVPSTATVITPLSAVITGNPAPTVGQIIKFGIAEGKTLELVAPYDIKSVGHATTATVEMGDLTATETGDAAVVSKGTLKISDVTATGTAIWTFNARNGTVELAKTGIIIAGGALTVFSGATVKATTEIGPLAATSTLTVKSGGTFVATKGEATTAAENLITLEDGAMFIVSDDGAAKFGTTAGKVAKGSTIKIVGTKAAVTVTGIGGAAAMVNGNVEVVEGGQLTAVGAAGGAFANTTKITTVGAVNFGGAAGGDLFQDSTTSDTASLTVAGGTTNINTAGNIGDVNVVVSGDKAILNLNGGAVWNDGEGRGGITVGDGGIVNIGAAATYNAVGGADKFPFVVKSGGGVVVKFAAGVAVTQILKVDGGAVSLDLAAAIANPAKINVTNNGTLNANVDSVFTADAGEINITGGVLNVNASKFDYFGGAVTTAGRLNFTGAVKVNIGKAGWQPSTLDLSNANPTISFAWSDSSTVEAPLVGRIVARALGAGATTYKPAVATKVVMPKWTYATNPVAGETKVSLMTVPYISNAVTVGNLNADDFVLDGEEKARWKLVNNDDKTALIAVATGNVPEPPYPTTSNSSANSPPRVPSRSRH